MMEKEIMIYGAGKYGKALYRFLQNYGVKISGFLQNKIDKEIEYESLPIYSLKEVNFNYKKQIILLAVADIDIRKYAKSSLIMKGIKEENILDCAHFIEENCLEDEMNEGNEHYCLICGKRIKNFLPIGSEMEIFKKFHIIGGGKRGNAMCPECGCLDRNRWCMYILANDTEIMNSQCVVLHFAPEEGITKLIKTNKECTYYSADLENNRAMLQMDLTDILFRDAAFDYIIVNHVLEHIADEEAAIRELKRVLKKDGIIIMSVPICMDQDTYEDLSIVSEEDRELYYGQKDHVRLYGKDYKERLESYGLSVEVKTPTQRLSCIEIEKYGFIKDDILLLCKQYK